MALTYTALFNPDKLTTVSSVTSGITGVILGYYFNRERLRMAQRRAERAEREREAARSRETQYEKELEDMNVLMLYFTETAAGQSSSEEGEE